ncbi:hypothetical protein HYQ46_007308 [Verticillium longisporum]|nr:hypothetical protein HYQ46_007308 [Verticillium longisporum]
MIQLQLNLEPLLALRESRIASRSQPDPGPISALDTERQYDSTAWSLDTSVPPTRYFLGAWRSLYIFLFLQSSRRHQHKWPPKDTTFDPSDLDLQS